MTRRVNLKVLPEMRERFYSAKERLSRETGRRLTHDEVLEIMIERLEKSALSAESLNRLEKVRQGLVKVTGREFTLDEAVEFLISFLLEGCSEGSESAGREKSEKEEDVKSAGEIDVKRARKIWEILEKKKEFVKGFYREPFLEPLTYADIVTRFIYVPDKVFEKIKAKANGNPPLVFLLTAAEQGAEIMGRYIGVVSDPQLNQEVISYLRKLESQSKERRERFINETQRQFNRVVREVLRRYKKKYG